MRILAIESSCDETAAAILANGCQLLANVVDSQVAVHHPYGGVVPELASRKHIENIQPVVEEALAIARLSLDDIDAVAVTQGPGLIGSLLVGLSFAKALAWARDLPCIGIDHLEAHLASPMFAGTPADDTRLEVRELRYPCVALVVSGGHTSIYWQASPTESRLLGRTLDDAAGEAFDKVAKLLGLGYPGGPVITRLAAKGDAHRFALPRAWLDKESLDFSFSGLKTAVALLVREQHDDLAASQADICASFQEAVVDVLVTKTMRAAMRHNAATVALAGGVAANPRLRARLAKEAAAAGMELAAPPPAFCTDNAAMVALAAWLRADRISGLDLGMDVYSRSCVGTTITAR